MRSNVVSEASLSTRASQWWASVPSVTSGVVLICSVIYVIDLLVGYDTFQQICFSPDMILGNLQVYRAYTSVLFHGSILHVAFNMLALVPIGISLERTLGSVRYLHLLLLIATTNATIHLFIAYIAEHNPAYAYPDFMSECQIGFSGIIFAMIVIEGSLYAGHTRSIFGFFNVPTKWYPWVLLIVFQLLMPRVSLLGHLSGIISGFAYVYGFLNIFMLSSSTCTAIESSSLCGLCMRRPGFIVGGSTATTVSLPSFTTNTGDGGVGNAWRRLRSSLAPQRESTSDATDERFPGTGRTLGGTATATTTVAAAAVAPSTATATRELETRLLDDDDDLDLDIIEIPPGGIGGQPMAIQHVSQVEKDVALRSLTAMGFGQNAASVALEAANGDITSAVEILSSQVA